MAGAAKMITSTGCCSVTINCWSRSKTGENGEAVVWRPKIARSRSRLGGTTAHVCQAHAPVGAAQTKSGWDVELSCADLHPDRCHALPLVWARSAADAHAGRDSAGGLARLRS